MGTLPPMAPPPKRASAASRALDGLFLAVDEFGDLKGQHALGLVDGRVLERAEAAHFVHGQEGEKRQALFHVRVVDIAPVLIELVGARCGWDRARSAPFSVLPILRPSDVKSSLKVRAKAGLLLLAADEIRAGEHVRPLVVAAGLQRAAVAPEQLKEVIGLHNHVVELEEGQSPLHALLVALGGEHAVDGEQRADLAQKVDVVEVAQPVGVVGDEGGVLAAGIEIEELRHLLFDAGDVVIDSLHGHHPAQVALAGGVADHARAARP